jgi:hypothetical protein
VASNWRSVTSPRAGCIPRRSRSSSVTRASSLARFAPAGRREAVEKLVQRGVVVATLVTQTVDRGRTLSPSRHRGSAACAGSSPRVSPLIRECPTDVARGRPTAIHIGRGGPGFGHAHEERARRTSGVRCRTSRVSFRKRVSSALDGRPPGARRGNL